MKKKHFLPLLVPIMAFTLVGCDDPNEGLTWANVIEKAEAKLGLDLAVLPEPTGNTKLEYSEQTNKVTIKAHYEESKLATYITLLKAASFEVESNVAIHKESEIRVGLSEAETNLVLEVSKYVDSDPDPDPDPEPLTWAKVIEDAEAKLEIDLAVLPEPAGHSELEYTEQTDKVTIKAHFAASNLAAYITLLEAASFEVADNAAIHDSNEIQVDLSENGTNLVLEVSKYIDPLNLVWQEKIAQAELKLSIEIVNLPRFKARGVTGYSYYNGGYSDGYYIHVEGYSFDDDDGNEDPVTYDANVARYGETLVEAGLHRYFREGTRFYAPDRSYVILFMNFQDDDFEGSLIIIEKHDTLETSWAATLSEVSAYISTPIVNIPMLYDENTIKFGSPASGRIKIYGEKLSSDTIDAWGDVLYAIGFEYAAISFANYAYFAPNDQYSIYVENDYYDDATYLEFSATQTRFKGETAKDMWESVLDEVEDVLGISISHLPIVCDGNTYYYGFEDEATDGRNAIEIQDISTYTIIGWLELLETSYRFEKAKKANGDVVWFAPDDEYCLWYGYTPGSDYIVIEVAPDRYVPTPLDLAWDAMLLEASEALGVDLSYLPILADVNTTEFKFIEATETTPPALGIKFLASMEPATLWLAGLSSYIYRFMFGKKADQTEVWFAPYDEYCLWYGGYENDYDLINIELNPIYYA